jgi:hypothetical protein
MQEKMYRFKPIIRLETPVSKYHGPLAEHIICIVCYTCHHVLSSSLLQYCGKVKCSILNFRQAYCTYLYDKTSHNDAAIVLSVPALLGSGTVVFRFSVQIFTT